MAKPNAAHPASQCGQLRGPQVIVYTPTPATKMAANRFIGRHFFQSSLVFHSPQALCADLEDVVRTLLAADLEQDALLHQIGQIEAQGLGADAGA